MNNNNPRQIRNPKELLKLAAIADVVRPGQPTKENGKLLIWDQLASAHPQRALDVTVYKGRSEWRQRQKVQTQQELSLMSWNTLVSFY